MINIKCKESEEGLFERCMAYECNGKDCEECEYYDCNISFEYVEKDKIEISSDEEIDIKVCSYNTFYNCPKCGVETNCDKCRFYYGNIIMTNNC